MDNLESPHEDISLESLLPPTLGSRVPELSRLVQMVTCSICYEMMVQPLSTSCLHSFCSLCVRGSLQYRQQCPLCHQQEYEARLRQDRTMETLLQLIRPLVRSVGKLVEEGGDLKENTDPNCPPVPPDLHRVPTPSEKSPLKNNQEKRTKVEQSSMINTDTTLPLVVETATSKTEKLSCHVCNVQVAKKNLNLHLARCMKSEQLKTSGSDIHGTTNSPKTSKLPPLPKLIYSLLKEAQLKKKCREFGLEAKGDKQALVGRLRRFTLLYNNEAQLERPRSVRLLAQQVEREEREEKQARVEIPLLLQYNKNTDETVREEKQKQYLKQNKSSFENLIQQVKNRPKKKENKDIETKTSKSNADLIMETVDLLEEASVDCVIDLVECEPSEDSEEPTEAAAAVKEEEGGKRNLSLLSQQEEIPSKKAKHASNLIESRPTTDNSDSYQTSVVSESKPTTNSTDVGSSTRSSDNFKQITVVSDLKPKTLVSDFPATGSLELPGLSKAIKDNKYSNPSPKTIKISQPVVKTPKVPSRGKKKLVGNSKSGNIINQLNKSSQQSRSGPKVSCPVCGTLVAEKLLNLHLDRCLKTSNSPTISRRSASAKKPQEESDTESELSQTTIDFSDLDDDNDLGLLVPEEASVRIKHPRVSTSKGGLAVWEMGVIEHEVDDMEQEDEGGVIKHEVEDMEQEVGGAELKWSQDLVEDVSSYAPTSSGLLQLHSPSPLELKSPPTISTSSCPVLPRPGFKLASSLSDTSVPPSPPSPSLLDPASPSPLFNKYILPQHSVDPNPHSSPLNNKYSVSQQSVDPLPPSSPLYNKYSVSQQSVDPLPPSSPLYNKYSISQQSVDPLLPPSPVLKIHSVSPSPSPSPIYNKNSVSQHNIEPASPLHNKFTASQQSGNPLPCSEPDMFDSDVEVISRPSSGNLLDLRDDIDKMVEEAISKEDEMKKENYENRLSKRKVLKVIPKKRQNKGLLIPHQDNFEITSDEQQTKDSPSSIRETQSDSVSSVSESVSSVSNVSVRLTRRSTRQTRTKLI